MAEKAAFFACLDDDQTGFFCAREYDKNIEELLMDVLTAAQMNMYYQYKKSKEISDTNGLPAITTSTTVANIHAPDYHFENELLEKLKKNNDFVWLDMWRKSQIDSEMEAFDNWREEAMEDHFLSLLSDEERGKFVILVNDAQLSDFITSIEPKHQLIFNQWTKKTIPQIPPFIKDLNLPQKNEKMILKLFARKDFNALDNCMRSFPVVSEMYGWWKSAVNLDPAPQPVETIRSSNSPMARNQRLIANCSSEKEDKSIEIPRKMPAKIDFTNDNLWNDFVGSLDNMTIGKVGPLLGKDILKKNLDDLLTVVQYTKFQKWATVQGAYPAFAKTFSENQQTLFYGLIDDKAYDALDIWMKRVPEWQKEYLAYLQKKGVDNDQHKVPPPRSSSRIRSSERDSFLAACAGHQKSADHPAELPTEQTEHLASGAVQADEIARLLKEKVELRSAENLRNMAAKVTSTLKKETNILMLGETGTGKSTMINSMANYFKYESFKTASENGLVTLVPTHFQLFDYENKPHDILVKPNVTTKSAEDQNAYYIERPKVFSFAYKCVEEEHLIRVMDTPGLGNPKGMDYDKQTFESILTATEEFDELHAICIIMKPNEATMTLGFRYCIKQLLSQLHVSAVQNIFFCFTFSNTTNYRPGQTVPTMGAIFKDMGLEGELNNLQKSRVFCFDNEAVKFLMAKEQGFVFNQGEESRLFESYSKSSFELFRMLLEMTCREPHNPKSTIHLNATRKLLNRLVKPLIEITRNHLLNEMLGRQEIEQIESNNPELINKLKVRWVERKLVTMETPRMVCTSQKCLGQNFKNGFKAVVEYKTICHNRCWQKEESDLVPNPLLEHCRMIKNGVCTQCQCPWTEHKHLSYEIEQELIEYEDANIKRQLASNETRKQYLEKKIQENKKQLETVQFFLNSFSEFSVFLARNTITNYSDVFMLYINQAIAEEERKYNVTINTSAIKSDPLLEASLILKSHYQQRLDKMSKMQPLSLVQINSLIKQMLQIGGCQELVDEILKFKAEMKKQAKDEEIEVSYPDGFLGGKIFK